MADLKPIAGQAPALRPAPTGSGDLGAVQRAFFDAALRKTEAASPMARPVEAPVQEPRRVTRAEGAETPSVGRTLRPGSLLDIKV